MRSLFATIVVWFFLTAALVPGVRVISSMANSQQSAGLLDSGAIELAVGVRTDVPSWQRHRPLFDWTFVCLYDPRHVRLRRKRITHIGRIEGPARIQRETVVQCH